MRFLLLTFALTALTQLAGAAPVPKEVLKKFPNYYPLELGNEWLYQIGGENQVLVVVTAADKKDGVQTGTLETKANGMTIASEKMRIDATGVYRTHINKQEIDPPILLLKFGIRDETEWATKCKIGDATVDFVFKLEGLEEIKTPAGDYKAVKVTGTGDIAGTNSSTTYLFADGVGIVKLSYVAGDRQNTLELKKFTPGPVKK
jgi:hypothetical protein